MAVDATEIVELRQLAANRPKIDIGDMALLHDTAEVLAFAATHARSEGWCEVDTVETLVRVAELLPDDVRSAERVLRPLGYRDVCARLRQITGKRKHTLVPLP